VPPSDPAPADQEREIPGAGGPRSAGTRRTILEAARAIFAARGYERTTIRAVARQAEIDPSMIIRYFGSKAGLFTAAAMPDLPRPDLTGVPTRRRGEFLVRHLVERWESGSSEDRLVFLLRTAVTNDAVTEQLQTQFNHLVLEPISDLDDPHADRRAALIGTQLLGLALCRYILRLEPLSSLSTEAIVDTIGPTIQRYLTQPIDP
jgi:AcrR family transcriptional regulator